MKQWQSKLNLWPLPSLFNQPNAMGLGVYNHIPLMCSVCSAVPTKCSHNLIVSNISRYFNCCYITRPELSSPFEYVRGCKHILYIILRQVHRNTNWISTIPPKALCSFDLFILLLIDQTIFNKMLTRSWSKLMTS